MQNNLKRMRRVLGRQDMRIAEVVGTNAGGEVVVDVVGGGRITVAGVGYVAGQKVFIKDNAIRQEAPSLTLIQIDV